MSSHLPFVVTGEIVPGPMYFIPRAGYTSMPISVKRIQPQQTAVPDTFRFKAEQAGQMRLRDDNLVKIIQTALQKQNVTAQQQQSTEKAAQPSDLSWRG